MRGVCVGIRVLDCSYGTSGSLATMVLADFGAEVVRVEPPRGEPSTEPSGLLLHRGKKSITLDLNTPSGQKTLHQLAPGFDVLVSDRESDAAAESGIDFELLMHRNPALVACSLTGFGHNGPVAGAPADDALVMAKAGIFRDQPGWEQDGKRPIYRASLEGSYFAGMLALQGILAALRARDLTGRGQRIDTNMLQAITCRQNPQVRWLLREGEQLPPDRAATTETVPDAINPLAHHRDPREVTLTGMLVQCKDGRWIMHSLSEAHFFPAWIEAIGFDWIWEEERFKGAPHRFPDDDAKVELVTLLQQRMKQKTSTEWMDRYLANGNVCADVIQSTQDALRHPQVIAADDLVEFNDPRVGRMLQIGPLAKIPTAPAELGRPAPERGAHTEEFLNAPISPVPVPSSTRRHLAGPLDGVTIVEAAYYYATPFATALLAELGARVIKIEPLRGDPYRLLGRGGGDPVTALGQNNMVRAMQGKESIALNLKDGRGREILHRLVAERGPLRAQLPWLGARDPGHGLRNTASHQAGSRLPIRGILRLGRPLLTTAGHRPRHRRVRRSNRLPDRRGESTLARERCRSRCCRRPRSGNDARTIGAPSYGRGPVRGIVDDRLEHLSQLRGRPFLRRKTVATAGRSAATRDKRNPSPLRVRSGARPDTCSLREPRSSVGDAGSGRG